MEFSPMTAAAPHPPTDLGNARRFVKQHGAGLRYVRAWGWLVWDGRRWTHDETGEVMQRAKEIPDLIRVEALRRPPGTPLRKTLLQWAFKSESRARLEAMVALAQTEPSIAVLADTFDADPWVLNVVNGTLNLRTGALRRHSREDLITKLAPVDYNPAATCPRFEAFLDRIMAGNVDLIRFLQRAIGYSLTGLATEQVLFILHGTGANGKSTFLEALRHVLGDYAVQADPSTFLKRDPDAIRNDVARLRGARFISAVEIGFGRHLDEALVKQATGGDTITARLLYREPFEFMFTGKVFLACNHKPEIRGADLGIWRRIRLIPFEVTIPPEEQDRHLLDVLKGEAPGILGWAVEGYLDWQREGLVTTGAVVEATARYREASDTLAGFLAERCVLDPESWSSASELYRAYRQWAEDAGERPMSKRRFGQMLAERGFKLDRANRPMVWVGLALRSDMRDASFSPVRYAVPFSPPRGNSRGTPIQDADIPEIARRLGRSG